jgi:hypothetical protein
VAVGVLTKHVNDVPRPGAFATMLMSIPLLVSFRGSLAKRWAKKGEGEIFASIIQLRCGDRQNWRFSLFEFLRSKSCARMAWERLTEPGSTSSIPPIIFPRAVPQSPSAPNLSR